MSFDADKFRESAKAANWSDDAINSYLSSKQQQSGQINAVTGKPIGQAGSQAVDKSIAEDKAAEKKVEDEKSKAEKFFDWVRTPVGTVTTGAVVLGALEGGRRLMNRGRGDGGSPNTPSGQGIRIDPTFDMFQPSDITDVTPKQPSAVGAPAGEPSPGKTPIARNELPGGPSIFSSSVKAPGPAIPPSKGTNMADLPVGVWTPSTQSAIPPGPAIAPQFGPAGVPAGDIPPTVPYMGPGPQTAPADWSKAPVSMPPPPDIPPQPVDPLKEARIRKAQAEAAMAEHKLQQLQSGAKVTPAGKTPSKTAGTVSESDLQMIQKSGEASTDKMLRSQTATAAAVDNITPTPDPIQATATPAEKQAAVDVVAQEAEKVEAKKQAPAIEGKVGAAVEPPEGYIPSYMTRKAKKDGSFEYKNKQGADVIGQGGWHWYQGQMGPEAKAEWEKTYGKTNQSYDTVKADVASGKLKGPEVVEGKGGKFPRQANVPNYIKGNVSPGMAGMLATLGLLGVAGSEKGREAMARATSAIKDLGVSPDIFAGKGEELGSLGKAYITAGNPNYIRELRAQLDVEKDPERRAILQQELQKAGGSGSGRGIAPPAAYMR